MSNSATISDYGDKVLRRAKEFFGTEELLCGKFELRKFSDGAMNLDGEILIGDQRQFLPSIYGATYHCNLADIDRDIEMIRDMSNFFRRYLDAAIELRGAYVAGEPWKAREAEKEKE